MFSKPNNPHPAPPGAPPHGAEPTPAAPSVAETGLRSAAPRSQQGGSLIARDMTLEGNLTGGGELQVDGAIKGDVRVERVTIGEGGHVDGGVYAEAVEVRGRVSGSITAKQVRLHGSCHVEGDISHEQLAMEIGAFFQGRSLRLQRPAAGAVQGPARDPAATPPAAPAKENGVRDGGAPGSPPLETEPKAAPPA